MSRTFEALQRAEKERKGDNGSPSVILRPPQVVELRPARKLLSQPGAATVKAALEFDRRVQASLEKTWAPVLLVPAVSTRALPQLALDIVVALASRRGLRPLLVDCDFFSPSIHRLAGIPRSRGVLDMVSGAEYQVRRVPISATDRRVSIFPAGAGAMMDFDVLDHLGTWLEREGSAHDRVFIAGPCENETATVAALADISAGVVLLQETGRRKRSHPDQALLEATQGKILGIVVLS